MGGVSAVRDWVWAVARETDRSDSGAMAARLRRLVIDLLANDERHLRQGQHEDALAHAYSVREWSVKRVGSIRGSIRENWTAACYPRFRCSGSRGFRFTSQPFPRRDSIDLPCGRCWT